MHTEAMGLRMYPALLACFVFAAPSLSALPLRDDQDPGHGAGAVIQGIWDYLTGRFGGGKEPDPAATPGSGDSNGGHSGRAPGSGRSGGGTDPAGSGSTGGGDPPGGGDSTGNRGSAGGGDPPGGGDSTGNRGSAGGGDPAGGGSADSGHPGGDSGGGSGNGRGGGPADGNPPDGSPPEGAPPGGGSGHRDDKPGDKGGDKTGDSGGGKTGDAGGDKTGDTSGDKGGERGGGGPVGRRNLPPVDADGGGGSRNVLLPSSGFSGSLAGPNSDPIAEAKAAAAKQAAAAEDERFLKSRAENFRPAPGASDPLLRAAALIRSAKLKLDMGDRTEAIRDATAALELAPGSPAALSLRATALNLVGRHEEAARDAREALKVRPDESALWENLAWANLRSGRYADAIDAAGKALKINPKSALALSTRGYARQMVGDMAGLREDLTAAAALDSRFAEKAELARAGKRVYDPNGDDASYLLGAAAAVASVAAGAVKLWPAAVGLMLFGAAALFIAVVVSRRRSSASRPHLEPLRPAPTAVPNGLLAGKYRLEGLVGRGGMGEVRRAKDVTLGRPVAIKTLVSALAQTGPDGAQWRDRLRKEAMTVAAVHHPGIVDIYEIVEEEGALHLVFEYIEGVTVHSMIAQQKHLTPAHCARLLSPVCDALSHAHAQGLIHRDLKPGNIMVTASGHVKLLDFGIARAQGETAVAAVGAPGPSGLRFDRTTTVAGTPVYMAPEAEGGLVGPSGDVYSLGVCLYEMLTSRRPFPDTATMLEKSSMPVAPPSAFVPGIPPAVDRLVAAAMSFDPAARPASAEAFKAALNDAARP